MNDFDNTREMTADEIADAEFDAMIGLKPKEEQRSDGVAELLAKNGVSREQVSTAAENPNEASGLADLVSTKQLQSIRNLAELYNLDAQIECRKRMQCEINELSHAAAFTFIYYLQSLAPARSEAPQSDTERVKEASKAAAANTSFAAQATAEDLVPEFGSVMAKYEPAALAYGFPPAVDALIEKAKLSPEQTSTLLSKFSGLFDQIDNWRTDVAAIVITGPEDKEGITKAKEIHKIIRDDRLNAEKRKKLLKEPYLRPGQLIDGVFKIYVDETEPLEREALEKAKTVENFEKERKEKIRAEREVKLTPYVDNVRAFSLHPDVMTDEAFDVLLSGRIELHAARQEQIKRENEERQRREDDAAAERVRIRRQNERRQVLSEMGFVRDAEGNCYKLEDLTVYDNEIENDSDINWRERVERLKPRADEIRVETKRRQEEGAKALRDQQDKERAERDENFRKQREAEAVALAPDKVKLERLADAIRDIELFETPNEKIIDILTVVKGDLYMAETKLRRQIDQLP